MAAYQIMVTTRAKKDIKKFKHLKDNIKNELLKLEDNPKEKAKSLKGNFSSLHSYSFSINANNYRTAFYLDEEKKDCLLILVGTRQNFYKELNLRWQSVKNEIMDE
ncbi:type II toxin-antitoxin system RelE family toxin [Fuchsiella alkaliacetigena]|uniref:type II toxin-antitoxin system RelE family toxin n=1 Tax=Fuchsiella alkaliacetigena TaxID=957042 RepID=UPI00200AADAC|nr:type II toxin-antitoxin system RelE/ParE family toxin [Fuchsiella alkaliacetigena]MCK8825884.1 type II toxin-antitoxin system RelE/ParE family toxin [Fuchsiella alkaliacetigena]